ncbi:hypothetical protein GCM10011380_18560 [Sphingomonas metalli]|uniref:Tat pathway signal protein n=1 Tax=Sphingomonas metalli TaxID=1779358 RepID=A0A916T2H4_9SPHN|nr:DUF885 family protein [Sphingomonas metalli]GGB29340.1 hypothetical protein GCM10011380_18560 [Sphingomonas metalli]
MTTRRTFLAGTAASLAATTLPRSSEAQNAPASPLDPLFADLMQAQLRRSPEGATSLGLDTGANADLRAKLSDQSLAAIAANKAATRAELARLEAVDRRRLTPEQQIDLDSVLYIRRSAVRIGQFDFGGQAYGPSPYTVSQQAGVYQSVPNFLDTRHKIDTAGDADAYLQRMCAFAGQLDAQTERMRREAAGKVVPPDFILDLTLAQMATLRTPAADATIVATLAKGAAAKGLSASYADRAARIWEAQVLPALDRQIAQARTMRATATHEAGVWKLPRGADFYPAALQATTTTSLSPEEVHRFGLDQAKAIGARLDAELRKLGYTQGTPGARMAALGRDPKYLFPDSEAGRAQAIAFCNERLAAIRGRLPTVFARLPDYRFEVRRVPPANEAGSASAYAQAPSLDGSRPGLVYFNLRDIGDWPRFALVTTTYHEGLPGHQMESGLALSNTRLPLIRKTGGFSGYGEGWALYAEQLADEIGMYDDDPLGRCGYLVAQLFRANRCVVDTGLHHYRWSREKAVAYFVEQQGDTESDAGREIDRYCVNPGQAASYKLGHSVFVDIREKAKAKLGYRFDLKAYHGAVLAHGRVPLDVLRRVGDDWIAAA